MLHKRFVFVSLLAPSLSFASTATDTLVNTTRDVFDNLDENPAFVNTDGGKSYLRIGKASGLQAITTAGGFGLGVQVGTLDVSPVEPLTGDQKESAKELTDAAAVLTRNGLPLVLSLGGVAGDMKWGAGLQYQNAKVDGQYSSTVAVFDPSLLAIGLNFGVIMGDTEASLGYGRETWKLATSGKTKTAAGEISTPLNDGMSEQSTDSMGLLVRHKMGEYKWFLGAGQSKTKAKFWEAAKNATTDRNELEKVLAVEVGAEREDKLTDGIMLFSQADVKWAQATSNVSKTKRQITDLSLSSAHGVEVAAASWATLRAGVHASLYGNRKTTTTSYTEANQAGTSSANTSTSTFVMRGKTHPTLGAGPTMGVGFKFGNYSIDASLTSDDTGSMGFSDKLLGLVEVTGQF
ncbi:MAG: hypothetical protein RLZZ488_540 [Pseudomonadota bacterium]|jgi:hypothetical protein